MKYIKTKYLCATNFKGMRIKATCDQFNITIPYNNNLEGEFVDFKKLVKGLVRVFLRIKLLKTMQNNANKI